MWTNIVLIINCLIKKKKLKKLTTKYLDLNDKDKEEKTE